MKASRLILVNVVFFLIIVALGIWGYNYLNEQWNYVSTNDAKVWGDLVPVSSATGGQLASWNGTVGQTFSAGGVIGTVTSATGTTNLTAPISGTIVQNNVVNGELVSPGEALGTEVNLNKLYILANIDETRIKDVSVGSTVDITVDADPGTTIKGTVEQIGLATNSTFSLLPQEDASGNYTKVTQRIPVTISMSGYPTSLVPGMNASVRIHKQ